MDGRRKRVWCRNQFLLALSAGEAGAGQRSEEKLVPEPVLTEKTIYGYLLGFVFNTVGFSFFLYGKKQKRYVVMACGVLLMGYPYILNNTYAIAGTGIVLCAAPVALKKMGVAG